LFKSAFAINQSKIDKNGSLKTKQLLNEQNSLNASISLSEQIKMYKKSKIVLFLRDLLKERINFYFILLNFSYALNARNNFANQTKKLSNINNKGSYLKGI
jgi:hypothetical protein